MAVPPPWTRVFSRIAASIGSGSTHRSRLGIASSRKRRRSPITGWAHSFSASSARQGRATLPTRCRSIARAFFSQDAFQIATTSSAPRPSHSARRPASRSAIKLASTSRTRRSPNSTARSIRSASRSASHWRRQRQRLIADGARDRRVEDREVGVDPRLEGVAAEPLAAELVEGADRGRLKCAEDPAPSRDVGAGQEPLAALYPDAPAELAGRLLGERHRDERAQGPRFRLVEVAEEPRGQHGRLATPRPRAQRHARLNDGHRRRLLLGQSQSGDGVRAGHSFSSSRGTSSRTLPEVRTCLTLQTAQ